MQKINNYKLIRLLFSFGFSAALLGSSSINAAQLLNNNHQNSPSVNMESVQSCLERQRELYEVNNDLFSSKKCALETPINIEKMKIV